MAGNSTKTMSDMEKALSASQCKNSCSGNGVCVNFTCICYDGFIGSDCSVLNNTASGGSAGSLT